MKKSILEIYALAVCFVTILCFAVMLGKGIYNIIQITNPAFTLSSWSFQQLQSNASFCDSNYNYDKKRCEKRKEEEITTLRQAAYSNVLQVEQRDGFQGLVIALIVMLVDIIIFIPHWIIARRSRRQE